MGRARGATRAWQTARDGLSMYRGTALLVALTAALALASVLPVASLLAPGVAHPLPHLLLDDHAGGTLGLSWVAPPVGPGQTRAEGLQFFFRLLLATSLATLAISAISLLTLFGARAMARESEVAVRRAVGASRRVLLAAAGLEALLIGAVVLVAGGGAGIVAGRLAAARWPGALAPSSIAAPLATIVLLGAILVTGALLPVIFARKRLVEAESATFALFWPALLQLALSLVVLGAGALLSRHAARGEAARAGRTDPVYAIDATPTPAPLRAARYARLLDTVARHPELGLASLTSPGAVTGLGSVALVTTDCGDCIEGNLPIRWRTPRAVHQFVSADSFKALGIPLLAGRSIARGDSLGAPRVAVVSRSLARDHFQGGEALGRTLRPGDDRDEWYTVVGVVDDVAATGLGGGAQPVYAVYLSILQHPVSSADLLLRAPSGRDGAGSAPSLAGLVPGLGLGAVRSEAALLAAETAPLAWFGGGLRLQGWAMLCIAALGLLAVMRIWVRSAYPEFGMRRAIGARHRQITLLVLREALLVAIGGAGLGLWFGPALWGALPALLPGLAPWDAGALLPALIALILVTLLGAAQPAWTAARATPHALLGSAGE